MCAKEPGKNGCGTITVMADRADEEVRDRVLTALGTPGLLAALLKKGTLPLPAPGIPFFQVSPRTPHPAHIPPGPPGKQRSRPRG
jgi:hypothetical protein